jgi:hypothetical protein
MRFPPIKPGRCVLWMALRADETVQARYEALRAVLKQCHLHPLDSTPAAEAVIVEEAAFRAHLDEARAALGAGDLLHLISAAGDRLSVEVIGGADAASETPTQRAPERRPPWQRM